MSYTETHFGKLRLLKIDKPYEEWCKEKCNEAGVVELSSYNKTWEEQLKDKFYNKYFYVNGVLYEVFDHKKTESDNYFMDINPINENEFVFRGQFDNGGTCFSEMMEEALEKIKNGKENQ